MRCAWQTLFRAGRCASRDIGPRVRAAKPDEVDHPLAYADYGFRIRLTNLAGRQRTTISIAPEAGSWDAWRSSIVRRRRVTRGLAFNSRRIASV